MRGEINHTDTDAFTTPVGLQPVEVSTVGTLPDLGKQVRQHCKGSSPKVQLKTVQIAWHLQSISHDRLLVLYIPREEDKHVLDIGSREVPDAVVPLDLICFGKIDVHPSDNECLSSHFSDSRYAGSKNS